MEKSSEQTKDDNQPRDLLKEALADIVLQNKESIDQLREDIKKLNQKVLDLAKVAQ